MPGKKYCILFNINTLCLSRVEFGYGFLNSSKDLDYLSDPSFVYVCRDGGAGAYEVFPDVCRLRDGRLARVFYAGYGHVSLPNKDWPKGGRIALVFSGDEGRTWTAPAVLFDGPDDDRAPSIAELRSGRLLCNFFSLGVSSAKDKPWEGAG